MTQPQRTPVIGIAGWKGSGKTTLTVRLVQEFRRRGLRVAAVKHAHHKFEIDGGETDSARHRRAGAAQVAIVSSTQWAIVNQLGGAPEPSLDEVLHKLEPADLVIVEGYKSAPIPKIEVRRAGTVMHRPLAPTDTHVIAIATDRPIDEQSLPTFGLDDIAALAEFIDRAIGPLAPARRI